MAMGEKRIKKKNIRTETIGFRLEPKLRFAAELAARKQRRSLSNFIEWAVEEAVKNVTLETYESYDLSDPRTEETAYDAINSIWDVDEADRFAKLALKYPILLDHEEEVLWKLIRSTGCLWKGQLDQNKKWEWDCEEASLIFDRLREHWEKFKKVANGELSKDSLPTLKDVGPIKVEAKEINVKDDIPF